MSNSKDKYHQIIELFKKLEAEGWSGSITFDFHRGNVSKKYKTIDIKVITTNSKD